MRENADCRGRYKILDALSVLLLVMCFLSHCSASDAPKNRQEVRALAAANDQTVNNGLQSADDLYQQGTMQLQAGHSKEAVATLTEALARWEEELGSANLSTAAAATTAQRLGEALALEGDHVRSSEAFARALEAMKSLFGKDSPQAIDVLANLGFAYLRQGEEPDAVLALKQALEASIRHGDGKGFGVAVPHILGSLVKALVQSDPVDGQGELTGALEAVEQINLVAWRYFVRQYPYEGQGVLMEALDAVKKEGEDVGLDASASRDLVLSAYLYNVAFLRMAVLGEYESAAALLHEALSLRAPVLGDLHSLTIQIIVSRGWALTLMGEVETAVDELASTGEALLRDGQASEAESVLRQALKGGYDPLGPHTYAYACFTQHLNMLKGWGSEGTARSNAFASKQVAIGKTRGLKITHPGMQRVSIALAEALKIQVEAKNEGTTLLQLTDVDKESMWEEILDIRKLLRSKA